jgi:hypothetical protein
MGLRMPQEADFHLPRTPTRNTTNSTRLTAWLMCQSNQTKANISGNDIAYFNEHGIFPHRSIFPSTNIILRLEIHNASNAHLFLGIRRPHFDIHPLSAQTLPQLRAVLVQQVRIQLSIPLQLSFLPTPAPKKTKLVIQTNETSYDRSLTSLSHELHFRWRTAPTSPHIHQCRWSCKFRLKLKSKTPPSPRTKRYIRIGGGRSSWMGGSGLRLSRSWMLVRCWCEEAELIDLRLRLQWAWGLVCELHCM